jgi:hypothetical protein
VEIDSAPLAAMVTYARDEIVATNDDAWSQVKSLTAQNIARNMYPRRLMIGDQFAINWRRLPLPTLRQFYDRSLVSD